MGIDERLYDPLELSRSVESLVTRESRGLIERKYFRFRGGRWYGGIASADVIGCNLRCRFCWAWYFRDRHDLGFFSSPREVFRRLSDIALKRGYKYLRLTGGEPTIAKEHLLEILKLAETSEFIFIVETNGILIGADPTYAKELSRFSNIYVRVSFKGTNPQEFTKLTGAVSRGFELQLQALRNLLDHGLVPGRDFGVAAMVGFSSDENIARFVTTLTSIDERLATDIDWEYVLTYPHVMKLLSHYNLKPIRTYRPEDVKE
ncbi:MAG: radical SAM protein [Desulfurococcaceae archaeon TW002]